MKPILCNTEMVRAIQEGRKTVTRLVIKQPWYIEDEEESRVSGLAIHRGTQVTDGMPYPDRPYSPGDILYVREAFWGWSGGYEYKADYDRDNPGYIWKPSIHMPREAARIFLRVKGLRVERLQDITDDDMVRDFDFCLDAIKAVGRDALAGPFWDNTIKLADRALYGWVSNPWVWVIEFERISEEYYEK